jgi:hypothetical protein
VYHQLDDEDDTKIDSAYLHAEYPFDYLGLLDDHPSDGEFDEEIDLTARYSTKPYWELQDNLRQTDYSTKPNYAGHKMVTDNGSVLRLI